MCSFIPDSTKCVEFNSVWVYLGIHTVSWPEEELLLHFRNILMTKWHCGKADASSLAIAITYLLTITVHYGIDLSQLENEVDFSSSSPFSFLFEKYYHHTLLYSVVY